MRSQKNLLNLLKGLVSLLDEEAAKNTEFANRLDELMTGVADGHSRSKSVYREVALVPDVYAEFSAKSETEFRDWLGDLPISMLRAIIRKHDFDATRRVSKLKDPGKLVELIANQIRVRLARGGGFLTPSGE
ncbi:MAG: hypothetical protein WBL50_10960 [Candidatus Acidiferrum sp.]